MPRMRLLTDQYYRQPPVAVGDVVIDVSCRMSTPTQVQVLRIYSWGLRVRSVAPEHPEPFDCTRWESL